MSKLKLARVSWLIAGMLIILTLIFPSCSNANSETNSDKIQVVVAENFWGSIASQIGGNLVNVTTIINDPNLDPHSYEPTSANARAVAGAHYVITNGVGYDAWMDRLIAANPSSTRKLLNAGELCGKKAGDNPHLWYNPDYVLKMTNRIHDDLVYIDPSHTAEYDAAKEQFANTGLGAYLSLIKEIKTEFSGTKVGATESIFTYMADSLGLELITPASYMKAVSEGSDITAADEAMVERQIDQKQIKLLVYNIQNTPPNVQIILDKAQKQGIPTVRVTETLVPVTATFQEWQTTQLENIQRTLKQASGN